MYHAHNQIDICLQKLASGLKFRVIKETEDFIFIEIITNEVEEEALGSPSYYIPTLKRLNENKEGEWVHKKGEWGYIYVK